MSRAAKIQLLSTQVANQIAAGEVIERPASVVKEVVENSLDAGASRITLTLEAAGSRLIQVRDDGRGMSRDDLKLALLRHATSKISAAKDLDEITSLGFRGEALASIAAVSRIELSSCAQDQHEAWQLCFSEGKAGDIVPVAHPQGTSITIRDLFYNVPARRKFLRSDRTEWVHTEQTVKRLALSRFDVAWVLSHDGRNVLRLPACAGSEAKQRRVARILGRRFLHQQVSVQREHQGLRVHGWLGLPSFHSSQTDKQYCYLNGRIIRDQLIKHAVRQAYGDRLPMGRHAAYVLFVDVPAAQVDVNVHPTKHEVRFSQARQVHDIIQQSVRDALRGTDHAVAITERVELTETARTDIEKAVPRSAPPMSFDPPLPSDRSPTVVENRPLFPDVSEPYFPQGALWRENPVKQSAECVKSKAQCVLFGRYVWAQYQEAWLLVDSRRLLARFLLLRLNQEQMENASVQQHTLLTPVALGLVTEPPADLNARLAKVVGWGFDIQVLGPKQLVLRALPALLSDFSTSALVNIMAKQVVAAGPLIRDDFLAELLLDDGLHTVPIDWQRCQHYIEQLAKQGELFTQWRGGRIAKAVSAPELADWLQA